MLESGTGVTPVGMVLKAWSPRGVLFQVTETCADGVEPRSSSLAALASHTAPQASLSPVQHEVAMLPTCVPTRSLCLSWGLVRQSLETQRWSWCSQLRRDSETTQPSPHPVPSTPVTVTSSMGKNGV